MDELKPCPFCGSNYNHAVCVYGEEYYIECLACTTCGPSGETKEEAIEVWNRRAESVLPD